MIKIVFFDVDGTLLKFGEKELTPNTLFTLKQLQNKGVLLCMATGRSFPSIPHFEGIEFDVLLTFNGSYIKTKDEIIYKSPICQEDVQIIVNNLKKMNRAVSFSNEETIIANGLDDDLYEYFGFGHEKYIIPDNFDELCKEDVYQIMCSCRKEEYEKILYGTSNSQIAAWWDKAVDIIPKDSGKGIGVKKVLDYYGFNPNEAIAFGDGKNDIEMLQTVGIGIAMGNSSIEVKQKADIVCKSVEEDGIYDYCLKTKLID